MNIWSLIVLYAAVLLFAAAAAIKLFFVNPRRRGHYRHVGGRLTRKQQLDLARDMAKSADRLAAACKALIWLGVVLVLIDGAFSMLDLVRTTQP